MSLFSQQVNSSFFPFALFPKKTNRDNALRWKERYAVSFTCFLRRTNATTATFIGTGVLSVSCLYVFFCTLKKIYPLHFYTSSSDIWTHILMSDLEISIRQKLVKLWDTLTQLYLKFSRWYTFIGKHSIFLPLSFTNADANLGTIFEMYSCQGWMCDDKSGVGWGL